MAERYFCDACRQQIKPGPAQDWMIEVKVASVWEFTGGWPGPTADVLIPKPDVQSGHYHAHCWPYQPTSDE